ncbi:hypothetical protein WYO_1809 [Methylobacterium sp. GXF4]|uniref:phage tail assembly protein n=1 Tax=Methylobacterium sp. GXF4 TaxID=1096546 RepID=UPI0002697C62|nr:phage tail assembly protein [Methylobacterium sp. GXF4]EIZ85443.1 hypothetical protein WYO_1809 [Methylobacterium sp. GXF4]
MVPRLTIPLAAPVVVDGVRHDALHLRDLKRRDVGAVRGGFDGEVGIALAARLAAVPTAVIYALDEADAERVGFVVSRLLDRVL